MSKPSRFLSTKSVTLPMVGFRYFIILAFASPTFAGLLRGNDGRGLGVTYVDEEDYYSETTTTSLSPGLQSVTSTVSASYKRAPAAATVATVTEVEHTASVASVTTTEEVTHLHPPAPVATVTATEEVTHAHHSVPVAAVTTTTEVTEVQHSAPDLAAAPIVKPVHVATEVTTFDAAPAVANYHASPSAVTFHAAPTAATVTHVSPVFTTETHVAPVYSYGVGSLGYGTGNYGYGHGLGAYGLNYGYGLGDPVEYAILLRRRKSYYDQNRDLNVLEIPDRSEELSYGIHHLRFTVTKMEDEICCLIEGQRTLESLKRERHQGARRSQF